VIWAIFERPERDKGPKGNRFLPIRHDKSNSGFANGQLLQYFNRWNSFYGRAEFALEIDLGLCRVFLHFPFAQLVPTVAAGRRISTVHSNFPDDVAVLPLLTARRAGEFATILRGLTR
jgi:hypothetical protein